MQVLGSFAAGVIGWLVLEFVGRPFRNFFDLRGEVIRTLTEFANLKARWKPARDDSGAESGDMEEMDMSQTELLRLTKAAAEIRTLAARMRAFAVNETFGLYAAKLLRYDPIGASSALIGLSNSLEFYGEQKSMHRKALLKALRIPELA
jgi:hypothetical protein